MNNAFIYLLMTSIDDYLSLKEIPEKLINSFFEQSKNLKDITAIALINANPIFLEKFAYALEDYQKPNSTFSYAVLPANKEDDFNTLREHVEKVRISYKTYIPIIINFDPYKYGKNVPNGFHIVNVLEFLKVYHIQC